jgi:hypothetical protein
MNETEKATHTPGPWRWYDAYGRGGVIHSVSLGSGGMNVLKTEWKSHDIEVREADAHLIAAAPDLLAKCKTALALIALLRVKGPSAVSFINLDRARFDLEAAIEKAEGPGGRPHGGLLDEATTTQAGSQRPRVDVPAGAGARPAASGLWLVSGVRIIRALALPVGRTRRHRVRALRFAVEGGVSVTLPTPEARLAELMYRAEELEGLEQSVKLPTGPEMGCVFQRPRYLRSKRVMEGYFGELCFTFYVRHEGHKRSLFERDALRLLRGESVEAVMTTTSDGLTGDDIFAMIARNQEGKPESIRMKSGRFTKP